MIEPPATWMTALVTLAVVGTSIGWGAVEVVRLRRAVADTRDHDAIFGGIVALAICVSGLVGVAMHYGL
ncbi:MAG: hypothetical protein D6689_21260 [Deltaproteobacteria bacterium]|nr:MAG: hypothetical protein D6689_21260 [Deltaproteobacteria bacterium]